ncbi:excinuclease ABC subunit UvrC [Gallicola sp. Sow4_E12]|uniref:excinuclease ABC subunit UvrC n=1 Tax=Gallicola sp. Sow4_E12 TaxID=3438785 RepID=UPI003F8E4734
MFNIEEELKKIPQKPGVYLMFNKDDKIIYVGKAINLRRRVHQYFDKSRNRSPKVKAMVEHIEYFEYIIVDNEVESLVLESNLIKENRPHYNILLRDDKQYPYIKITNESFPRVLKVRSVGKDNGKYFGPYPNAYAVNDIIDLFHEMYKIRDCNLNFDKGQYLKRPCLNYFIERCDGPCVGKADKEKYQEQINEVEEFLKGKEQKVIKELEAKMMDESRKLNFESAAKYRDRINNISIILEKQKVSNVEALDMDMISLARDEGIICAQVFFMRNGKIIDREHFFLEDDFNEKNEEIMSSFMKQFYVDLTYIPKTILVDILPNEAEGLGALLSEKRGNKVEIRNPQRGDKVDLMEMVRKNAKEMLEKYIARHFKRERNIQSAILDLQELTGIPNIDRIECYDISNTSGVQSVGSMIVFTKGKKDPKEYRKFKIKTVEGPDDYASHREVLTRRLKRGLVEEKKGNTATGFGKMPDIILMDGGKGQVNIAESVLQELGIRIPVLGLVKDQDHKTRGIIYRNREYPLKVTTAIYRLLYQIQEEAHRFAINYHRKLREKALQASELDSIAGIGPARKKELLKYFKSIAKIRKATVEELKEVPKINQQAAENIYNYFKEQA